MSLGACFWLLFQIIYEAVAGQNSKGNLFLHNELRAVIDDVHNTI